MEKKSLNITKIILEIIFIAFAVFLGQLVGQWNENNNNLKLADVNLENIYEELIENKKTLEEYSEKHQKLIIKFNEILASSDKENIINIKKIDFFFNFELLNNSAWNTAKLTRSVSYMDFSLVKNISIAYDFQEQYLFLVKDHIKRDMYHTLQHDSKFDYNEFINNRNFLSKIILYEVGLIDFYNFNIKLIENKIRPHNNV